MTKILALADMSGLSELEIKDHIASNYRAEDGTYPYASETERLSKELDEYNVLVAYESVGSWGCDSASFFLLRKGGKLYENHGGHCSCYGFEGQWGPEETSKGSLQQRSYFAIGGYDEDSEANTQAIKEYIAALPDDA